MKLEWPDSHYRDAALGWLDLGNWLEANEDIERISPAGKAHPDVLEVRCKIYVVAEKWELVVEVARAMCRLRPDSVAGALQLAQALRKLNRIVEAHDALAYLADEFPEEWCIAYQLACYCCLLGDRSKALWWLENAIDVAGTYDIRLKALDDPDLATLWVDIAEI